MLFRSCRLAKEGKNLKPAVYDIDPAQDQHIALVKLEAMKMKLDVLTKEQSTYADDYSAGT